MSSHSTPKAPFDDTHGRHADYPSGIPTRGWRDILLRVWDGISEKNLSLIAAGIAFYAFIAVPSGITALISLYGLVFDPHQVQAQVDAISDIMPREAVSLVSDEMTYLTSLPSGNLGIGLIASLAVALWSANSATTSMVTALNVIYEERESRNLFKFYAEALLLTVASVLFAIFSLMLIAGLPAIINLFHLADFGTRLAEILRWPVLVLLFMIALALSYRFAPCRQRPKWRWVSWGAISGGLLWIVASALFSFYAAHFASYDKSYGSLAGVILLLMWLYVSAFVILLGAELNAELEHQTARDSTTGPELPMGQRGATMADTLGEER